MALTDNLDALVEDIVPDSPGQTPEQDTARAQAVVDVKDFLSKFITHVQTEGVVNTSLDATLSTLFAGAVAIPNDGGFAIDTTYKANAGGHPNASTGSMT